MINYTKLSLDYARDILGWTVAKAEYWMPSSLVMEASQHACRGNLFGANQACAKLAKTRNAGVRKDLFGFVDIVALGEQIIAIQSTSYPNMSARRRKIEGECTQAAEAWIRAGGRIEVWGFRKHDSFQKVERFDGTMTRRKWLPKIVEVTKESMYNEKIKAAG